MQSNTKPKQKKNTEAKLTRTDRTLFIGGIVAATLVAVFIANGFFRGHAGLLLLEVVSYIAIVTMYVQTFRASRTSSLVRLARFISYGSITTAVLIALFIAYFVATFRW